MNMTIRTWGMVTLPLLLVLAGLIYLLEPTTSSMMAVWDSSETYAHGYVILPMVLWLVWRMRQDVIATTMHPDAWALLPILAMAGIWLAGRVVGALVVEHFALVGLLMLSVWALYGLALVRVLLFPLFFLLLMVPAGDSLIEPMIHFTAEFTVMAVRLVGIPVYQEGTFFVLPSGEWSVVEACSGIRYFLSSIVLGWLFAYLTYRTWWKRLAFGAAAVIVPVIANGLRATLIVLIGHYSGMTLAVGVDHLIYGWVWFGIVMLIMFWIGIRWREDEVAESQPPKKPAPAPRPAFWMAALIIAVVALFPYYERQLSSAAPLQSPLAKWAPPATWQPADSPVTDWRPRWLGMDDQRTLHLQKGNERVMLFAGWYGAQRQGAELINSQNVLVAEKDPAWRNLFETGQTITLGNQTIPVRQAKLHSPKTGQRLLVWHWQHIDGKDDTSQLSGKLRLALSKLAGHGDAATGILVAAPYVENIAEAEKALQTFLIETRPSLNSVLDSRASQP